MTEKTVLTLRFLPNAFCSTEARLEYGSSYEEKTKAIVDLRDSLATLKWEIWETEYQKRSELNENEWSNYCKRRFEEWPFFNLNYIDGLVFKPKNIVSPLDAFDHLNSIIPNLNNAFLLNKRWI